MKKLFYIIVSGLVLFMDTFVVSGSLQSDITDNLATTNSRGGRVGINDIFAWLKDELFIITMVIAVGVFVFIGIRMASSRGNPEEFKKSWLHFVYAFVGLFIIFAAYGIVQLVSSLGTNF